jgi:hypothetical protein
MQRHQQHWAGRNPQETLGHAAQHEPPPAAPPVRAHDHAIDAEICRCGCDPLGDFVAQGIDFNNERRAFDTRDRRCTAKSRCSLLADTGVWRYTPNSVANVIRYQQCTAPINCNADRTALRMAVRSQEAGEKIFRQWCGMPI